jgi:hypothetical protein
MLNFIFSCVLKPINIMTVINFTEQKTLDRRHLFFVSRELNEKCSKTKKIKLLDIIMVMIFDFCFQIIIF